MTLLFTALYAATALALGLVMFFGLPAFRWNTERMTTPQPFSSHTEGIVGVLNQTPPGVALFVMSAFMAFMGFMAAATAVPAYLPLSPETLSDVTLLRFMLWTAGVGGAMIGWRLVSFFAGGGVGIMLVAAALLAVAFYGAREAQFLFHMGWGAVCEEPTLERREFMRNHDWTLKRETRFFSCAIGGDDACLRRLKSEPGRSTAYNWYRCGRMELPF